MAIASFYATECNPQALIVTMGSEQYCVAALSLDVMRIVAIMIFALLRLVYSTLW